MTVGGWIMMTLSVGLVVALFVACLWKVLRTQDKPDRIHGFGIDTKDRQDD